jgi:hypothetical protein
MNASIHPAEQPLLAYADYQVEPEPSVPGQPNRFRAQQIRGKRIVCIVGSFDTVVQAVVAIEEHAMVRQVELS